MTGVEFTKTGERLYTLYLSCSVLDRQGLNWILVHLTILRRFFLPSLKQQSFIQASGQASLSGNWVKWIPGYIACIQTNILNRLVVVFQMVSMMHSSFPDKSRHRAIAGSMLGQRRRRWANIKPTMAQCLVLGRSRVSGVLWIEGCSQPCDSLLRRHRNQ